MRQLPRWLNTGRWRTGIALMAVLIALTLPRVFAGAQQARALELALHSPIRSMAFWHYDPQSSVQSRVLRAPPELLQYLAAANVVQGYQGVPSAVDITPDLKHDFDQAIEEMPENVQRLVAQRLIGVFIVKDLGSTGMTDLADAFGSQATSGLVIIDASVFEHRDANSWAAWKESSPFIANPDFSLSATIENQARNDRVHAIQYILLHEFGHVVSIERAVAPAWNRPPPADHQLSAYPFARLSWRVADDGHRYLSTFDQVLPMRDKLHFYVGGSINADQMPLVYKELAATSFPTLYGATNVGDDFAESFANYAHVVLMHQPYSIEIRKNGQLLETYTACWSEARCQNKRAILEALLEPSTN